MKVLDIDLVKKRDIILVPVFVMTTSLQYLHAVTPSYSNHDPPQLLTTPSCLAL